MYARGMTTRQISDQIQEIYGFECSEGFISDVTDKVLQDVEDWQDRPLDSVYPILFIDAVHFSGRQDHPQTCRLRDHGDRYGWKKTGTKYTEIRILQGS